MSVREREVRIESKLLTQHQLWSHSLVSARSLSDTATVLPGHLAVASKLERQELANFQADAAGAFCDFGDSFAVNQRPAFSFLNTFSSEVKKYEHPCS